MPSHRSDFGIGLPLPRGSFSWSDTWLQCSYAADTWLGDDIGNRIHQQQITDWSIPCWMGWVNVVPCTQWNIIEWGLTILEPKLKLNLLEFWKLKSVYLSHDTFFSGVGAIFGQECQKRGMLVRVAGDGIMMSPTLIMTPGEVDEVRPVIHSMAIVLSSLEYPCNIDRFAFSAGEHLRRSP